MQATGTTSDWGTQWLRWRTAHSLILLFMLACAEAIGLGVAISQGSVAAPFALALCVALACVALAKPALGTLAFVAAFPFTVGLQRGLLVPGLKVSELLFFVFLASYLVGRLLGRRPLPKVDAIDLAFLLLVAAGTAVPLGRLAASGETPSADDLRLALQPAMYYLLYLLVRGTMQSPRSASVAVWLLGAGSLVVAGIGLLQAIGWDPVVRTLEAHFPAARSFYFPDRITSVLGFWNGLAAYLAFAILLMLPFALSQRFGRRTRLGACLVLTVDSIALVATGTYAAFAGVLLGGAIVARSYRRVGTALAGALGLALLGAAVSFPFLVDRYRLQFAAGSDGWLPQTMAYRIQVWSEQYSPALANVLPCGWGLRLPASVNWPYFESLYVQLLAIGGLIYLLSYLALIVAVLRVLLKKGIHARSPLAKALSTSALAVLVSVQLMNFTQPYFYTAGGAQLLWILVGLAVTVRESGGPQPLGRQT